MSAHSIVIIRKPVSAKSKVGSQGARAACDRLAPQAPGLLERYRQDQSGLRREIMRSARRARNEGLISVLGRIFG